MANNQPYDQRQNMQLNPGGDDPHTRPRRPNAETEARLLSGTPRASNNKNMARSTLSANAPEFVPKSYANAGSLPIELTDPAILLSASAPEFVPSGGFVPRTGLYPPDAVLPSQSQGMQLPHRQAMDGFLEAFNQLQVGGLRGMGANGGPPHPHPATNPAGTAPPPPNNRPNMGSNNSSGGGGGAADELTSYLLQEFKNTMLILMTQPGNIPEYMRPLCEKLRQAGSPDVLQEVVDVLYHQSIYEQNFRYTGARVCHFMCNHLKDHHIFGQFKATFLKRCQQDFLQRDSLAAQGMQGMEKLCGLTLFMGELFLNVTVEQGEQTERLTFLPSALTDLMLTLVAHPMDMSVKTICQLLKLAGGPTEDSLKSGSDSQILERFSNIFSALTALKESPQLAPNMKTLIVSVLKFRGENWGRTPPGMPGNSPIQQRQNDYNQGIQAEPVFFNVQGQQITREEAGYSDETEAEDGHYVLTEDEEREFLAWQAETTAYGGQMTGNSHPERNNHRGYEIPANNYQRWSTDDGYGDYQGQYGYGDYAGEENYGSYMPDGLQMDEEAEKAYEDFLNLQRGGRK